MRPTVIIPVKPVPKPRMTRSDKWKKRPAVVRYFTFKDDLSKLVKGTLNPRFQVTFFVPIPPSWSKTKRAAYDGKPHQQRPDADNFLKAFMDALCVDDSYIYDVRVRKFWTDSDGYIELTEYEI